MPSLFRRTQEEGNNEGAFVLYDSLVHSVVCIFIHHPQFGLRHCLSVSPFCAYENMVN